MDELPYSQIPSLHTAQSEMKRMNLSTYVLSSASTCAGRLHFVLASENMSWGATYPESASEQKYPQRHLRVSQVGSSVGVINPV
eukprot:754423-Hanusia_phi.AAC.3